MGRGEDVSRDLSGLPKARDGSSRGRPYKGFAFSEIIEKVGSEVDTFAGLPLRKKELVVRIMFELLTYGKYAFPDGREMTVDYDRWQSLAWQVIKHLEATQQVAEVQQKGSLIGSSLNTQVVLYLPNNQREVGEVVAEFRDLVGDTDGSADPTNSTNSTSSTNSTNSTRIHGNGQEQRVVDASLASHASHASPDEDGEIEVWE